MKHPIVVSVALTAILALAGCGRKDPLPMVHSDDQPDVPSGTQARPGHAESAIRRAPPPTDTAGSATHPDDPHAALSQPAHPVVEGYVHPFMTSQLRIFIRENNRMPDSFAEFANARMDSVPFPPDGMEYAIDYHNRQIKVVRSRR